MISFLVFSTPRRYLLLFDDFYTESKMSNIEIYCVASKINIIYLSTHEKIFFVEAL